MSCVQMCANSFYASLITYSATLPYASDTQLRFSHQIGRECERTWVCVCAICSQMARTFSLYDDYFIVRRSRSHTHVTHHSFPLNMILWAVYGTIIIIRLVNCDTTVRIQTNRVLWINVCVCVHIVFSFKMYETDWENETIPLSAITQ